MYSKKIYTSFTNRKPTSWDETGTSTRKGVTGPAARFWPGYAQPLEESGTGCLSARRRQKASSKGSGGSVLQG